MARTTGTTSLKDLMQMKTLEIGETLVLRRRSAPPIEATLEADGRLRVGGDVYATPSTAAKRALGVRAVDGWLRWRVPRLGDRTLADLRSEGSA